MPDEIANRAPEDLSRLSMAEEFERRFWADKFGVIIEDLAVAVLTAGPMASDVEAYLRNKHQRTNLLDADDCQAEPA